VQADPRLELERPLQHRERPRRRVTDDRRRVLGAREERLDQRRLGVVARDALDLARERLAILDPRRAADALGGALPARLHEQRKGRGERRAACALAARDHGVGRYRDTGRRHEPLRPRLVEARRERERVGAERRHPGELEQHGSPGLAVPRAEALGDVQRRVHAERRARPDPAQEIARSAETHAAVPQALDRALERGHRLLGLVLGVRVRRARLRRGAPEQIEHDAERQARHGGRG
jgi:hypothetical protein